MNNSGRIHILIIYARKDQKIARDLKVFLDSQDYVCNFIPSRATVNNIAEEGTENVLLKAVRKARYHIVLLSPDIIEAPSKYSTILFETSVAVANNKLTGGLSTVVPILLNGLRVENLPPLLRDIEAINPPDKSGKTIGSMVVEEVIKSA